MDEHALAQGMIAVAARVAAIHRAEVIERIVVRMAAVIGVEPAPLARAAFEIARAGRGVAAGNGGHTVTSAGDWAAYGR